jgi:glycerol kinase
MLKRWLFNAKYTAHSSGLPLSTYFSAIKLRWMIDHHPEVKEAHEKDDLMFGTVDSWVVYVSDDQPPAAHVQID